MQKSETIALLAAAFVKAQPEVKTALMDSTNPFFKSKYADLGSVWDAVRDALSKNGLAVTQFPDAIGGEPALTTCLIHESGQWIEAIYPLAVSTKDENAQGFGSAITYARRYGLAAVMGVIADTDDDGNAASKPPNPAARPSGVLASGGASDAQLHNSASRSEKAREWALAQIPKIKTMDRAALDAFTNKYRQQIIDLKELDSKASVELDKAVSDRLEALFA